MPITTLKPEDEQGKVRRDGRYLDRDFLAHLSTIKRVRSCGRNRVDASASVVVKLNDGRAHLSNVQSCGSVWSCPVCSAKVRHRRALEVEAGLRRHLEDQGGALLVTFTLPHHAGLRLDRTLGLVADSFRSMLMGEGYRTFRNDFGVVGTIRSLEVTHGGNGWHPHLHVLVLLDQAADDVTRDAIGDFMFGRWADLVERNGHGRPMRQGFDVAVVGSAEVGAYVSKVYEDRAALEVARGDLKSARGESRDPLTILREARTFGDVEDLALWHEYERATKGRQFLSWSKGLRARLGLDEVEASDHELAAEEVGGVVIATVPTLAWLTLRKLRGGVVGLLRAAEGPLPEVAVHEYLEGLPPPR